jgi:NADPH2:quinone reductase
MRSISYTETGPSSVLQLVEKSPRQPGASEILVRIAVSGVNPTDWKARAGSAAGVAMPETQVPNQDGAGIVEAIGDGVTHVDVDSRVWVWDAAYKRAEGTAQELAMLPAHQVVALPDTASFDVGASLGIPALTAHRALTSHEDGPARLSPGSLTGTTVLVAGGAGAVGHAAIQLAKWAGATVITTVSSDEKAALARRAGAHHIVNYREEDAAARIRELAPDGVATIVEVNPTANIDLDFEILAPGGTIAIYVSDENSHLPVPVRPGMSKNVRLQFILTYTTSPSQKADAVAAAAQAVADGALEVGEDAGLPLTRFALEDTAAAHDAVESGTVGKVLIDVAAL